MKQKLSMTSVVTGTDGKAVFTGLQAGMYLVREGNKTGNAVNYNSFEPYLVMVPGVKNGQWVYDVTAYPKMEITAKPTRVPPTDTPGQPTVPTTSTPEKSTKYRCIE